MINKMADDFEERLKKIKEAAKNKDTSKSDSLEEKVEPESPKNESTQDELVKEEKVDDASKKEVKSEPQKENEKLEPEPPKEEVKPEPKPEPSKAPVSKPAPVQSTGIAEVMKTQKEILTITQGFVDSVNARLDAIEKKIKSGDLSTDNKTSIRTIGTKKHVDASKNTSKKLKKHVKSLEKIENTLDFDIHSKFDEINLKIGAIENIIGILSSRTSESCDSTKVEELDHKIKVVLELLLKLSKKVNG